MSAARAAEKPKSTPDNTPEQQAPLRKQLIALLRGGQAHATFDQAVDALPPGLRGAVPSNLPYSAWQLLEHLRIAQRDILDFSAPPTGGYHPIEWPDAYWPDSAKPPSAHAWDESIAAIHRDLKSFLALIEKPSSDLYKPFRWGDGQNLLREALLLADHNAYHIGELILLRRLLGAWHK
ncbi:MAG TPA: DinB family protein [Edaphobacter sp.]|nr:DinB family protein [Edaphobacter sp.]